MERLAYAWDEIDDFLHAGRHMLRFAVLEVSDAALPAFAAAGATVGSIWAILRELSGPAA